MWGNIKYTDVCEEYQKKRRKGGTKIYKDIMAKHFKILLSPTKKY